MKVKELREKSIDDNRRYDRRQIDTNYFAATVAKYRREVKKVFRYYPSTQRVPSEDFDQSSRMV